jgi:hypothetical protein
MNRIKLVLLSVMAITAITAVASATASALPEFLPAGTLATFTSTSGPGTLESASGTQIVCSADTNSGSITGATTVKLTIKFTGCKAFGFINCKTSGAGESEIVVNATGTLGYVSKTGPKVGLALAVTPFEFSCAGGLATGKVQGTLIGEVTPVNTKSLTGKLILTQSKGSQTIKLFEGGSETQLEVSQNGGAFEKAGEQTTDTITFAEEITVDA